MIQDGFNGDFCWGFGDFMDFHPPLSAKCCENPSPSMVEYTGIQLWKLMNHHFPILSMAITAITVPHVQTYPHGRTFPTQDLGFNG